MNSHDCKICNTPNQMIKYNDFEQTKRDILRYVEGGDYSRPHIVVSETFSPALGAFLYDTKNIPGFGRACFYGWDKPTFAGMTKFMKKYAGNFVIIKIAPHTVYKKPDEELKSVISHPVEATRPWFILLEGPDVWEWIDEIPEECDINFYTPDPEQWLKEAMLIQPDGSRAIDHLKHLR